METPKTIKHVLIADDDPTTRMLFGSLLARAGYEVLYAKDGNDAREMARRLQPDLILLDLNMPIMDGMEVATRLKTEPKSVNINTPIAFLTNEDLGIEAQKMIKELGVADYIQKGVSNEEFIARVKKLLP
ncbi:MAG: response regulator [Sedimentisphaerales bacterium]|nr:response regulator [Sedimentisphaerales bacterium]